MDIIKKVARQTSGEALVELLRAREKKKKRITQHLCVMRRKKEGWWQKERKLWALGGREQ